MLKLILTSMLIFALMALLGAIYPIMQAQGLGFAVIAAMLLGVCALGRRVAVFMDGQ